MPYHARTFDHLKGLRGFSDRLLKSHLGLYLQRDRLGAGGKPAGFVHGTTDSLCDCLGRQEALQPHSGKERRA